MKQFLTVLLCALTLVLQGETLRVGSYNILTSTRYAGDKKGWEARKERVVGLLKQLDMDVYGLQEVHGDQQAFLSSRLPEYVLVGERAHPTNKRFCFVPVVYRRDRFTCEESGTFWLSETPDVAGSRSWDSSEPRVCTFAVLKDRKDGQRFVFANTHLDHKGALARANGAKVIVERLNKFKLPIMLVGDHNSNELEEAAQTFQPTLDNAFNVSETVPKGCWRTFNAFKWRETEVSSAEALKMSVQERNSHKGASGRIDFIYVTRGTRVRGYRTVSDLCNENEIYPSDHFPVLATVDIGGITPKP